MPVHLLVAVDGSAIAESAVETALSMARRLGARLTVFYAMATAGAYSLSTLPPFVDRQQIRSQTLLEIHQLIAEQAQRYLESLVLQRQPSADDLDAVAMDWECCESDKPWQAILDAASRLGCDLIVMASHGRHGLEAVLLGSETQKVVTHSTVPVLVVPPPRQHQVSRVEPSDLGATAAA